MKIVIVSDSHYREVQLERFVSLCKKERYDLAVHLGDCVPDSRWLEKRVGCPMIRVAGNCDPFAEEPNEAIFMREGHRILAVHGHRQHVKTSLDTLSYYAESQNCEIALYGHTHIPFTGYVGGILCINPGTLQAGDYCELTLTAKDIIPVNKTL